jgi:ribosomal protein L37AE/L43A
MLRSLGAVPKSVVVTPRNAIDPLPMYVTDLTHFLDKSGAIGPVKGPARAMAQFMGDAVAHASDTASRALPAPKCFKCKKGAVEVVRAQDDAIVWICPKCRTEGRISNWQGSLWDLRNRPPSPG